MAVPYMFNAAGQPILMGQIPILPQPQFPGQPQLTPQQQQSMPPPQAQQAKLPDYMSEEKLQEKGTVLTYNWV